MGLLEKMKKAKVTVIEDAAKTVGAEYISP